MVRSEAAAEESLAAIRARIRFGIAIAAMIRMMATTISSSISEKPFCFRISFFPSFGLELSFLVMADAVVHDVRICRAKYRSYFGVQPRPPRALFSVKRQTIVSNFRVFLTPILPKSVSQTYNSCHFGTALLFENEGIG